MNATQVIKLLLIFLTVVLTKGTYAAGVVDLARAKVVASDESAVVGTAQRMLIEEVAKRTGIQLAAAKTYDGGATATILLCRTSQIPSELQGFVTAMHVPESAEGFAIAVDSHRPAPLIALIGRDERGVLFAAGRLLLQLRMGQGMLELPAAYRVTTAPRYPIRGHQIAYRNLSHCYDAWSPATYEQYMRELAVFGANAFETTTFSAGDGPHGKLANREMSAAWSRICGAYDFDFCLFDSAVGGAGKSPEEEQASIESRLDTIRAMPHLDHLYLTGGDGGSPHRRPDLMLELTGQFAKQAREIHPDLGIWVSNQGFAPELNNQFFEYLERHQPTWITGVVYGPWTRILLDEQRARVPSQYPIRRYPDIGHCLRSQYPVAGWDRALARTLGREPFAPRPRVHARIHNLFDEYANGFVTYSDGVGDDVNKFVWTALGWDPDRDLEDVIEDYARFFFGWQYADKVRQGLFLLEENFAGSLATNEGVGKTFALWRQLERTADKRLLSNWRFQQCLLRAYFDQYTRMRLLNASEIERRAYEALADVSTVGVERAIFNARRILCESDQNAETDVLRVRIRELGANLYESIGAQLDVKTYQASSAERGAILDFLDTPLNHREWLEHEFDAILAGKYTASMPESIKADDTRLQRLARVVNWEDPGPGGFYDDLGCSWKQPHLVRAKPLWDDPAGITTPREGHTASRSGRFRLSWLDVAEALNSTPLTLRYDGLDPQATYRVRVTYLGRYNAKLRLVADEKYEIHGAYGHTRKGVRYATNYQESAAALPANSDRPVTPIEFVIPPLATEDGVLELTWQRLTGRGAQVAEVWLIKQAPIRSP